MKTVDLKKIEDYKNSIYNTNLIKEEKIEEGLKSFFKKIFQFFAQKLLKRNRYIVDFDFDIPIYTSSELGNLIGYSAFLKDEREIVLFYLTDGSSKELYCVSIYRESDPYEKPYNTIVLEQNSSMAVINQSIEELITGNLQESYFSEEEMNILERKSPAQEEVYAWIEEPEFFDARLDIIQDEKLAQVYAEYVRTSIGRPVSQASFITYIKEYLSNNGLKNKWTRGPYTVKKNVTMSVVHPPEEQSKIKSFSTNSDIIFSWKEAFEDMEDDFQDLIDDPTHMPYGQLVYGNGGTGKAQPLYSKVLTSNGFKTMGEIEIGDGVITPNGDVVKVIETFPQEGERDVYEFTFSDGSKTRADINHLWKVWYQGNTNKVSVKTTEDILKKGLKDSQGRWHWSIPLNINPIDFGSATQEIKFDPYVLGVLLGDGCFRSDYPTFTTTDSFIKDEISKRVEKYGCTVSEISDFLKENGLWGLKSDDKFIPEQYKYCSINNRLEILQGLIDSDGYIAKNGYTLICLKSEKLIDDIRFIVKSLGGWASKKEKIVKFDCANGNTSGIFYNLTIVLPEEYDVASLPMKKDLYKKGLTIRDISYVGKEKTKCIMIDSDEHLYMTDDFIVTHNSYFFTRQAEKTNSGYVKGAPNTARLVRILYDYKDKEVIIFDDADSIITNANSANILKMATDDTTGALNNGKRIIYLPKGSGKDMKGIEPDVYDDDGNLIQAFYFSASVVIITNLPDIKDKALKTRLYLNPIFMDKEDIIEKIMLTIKPEEFGATEVDSRMVADFLIKLVENGDFDITNDQLSYRFFTIGLKLRKRYPNNWTGKLLRKLNIGIKSSYKDLKAS